MSPTLAEEVTPLNDGSVIIDGTANVREINKAFNWHLPEDEARTINGIIPKHSKRSPLRVPAYASNSMISIFLMFRRI
jgi:Mg2+/Co2+ transporter CorB